MKYRKENTGLCYHVIETINELEFITSYAIITYGVKYVIAFEKFSEPLTALDSELFYRNTHEVKQEMFYNFLAEYKRLHDDTIDRHLPSMEFLKSIGL